MKHILNDEEIDVLIEALDSWENKDVAGDMMTSLFDTMFEDKFSPEVKLKMENDKKIKIEKSEIAKKMRKETSTLLKAKFIQLKQEQCIARLQTL